MVLAVEQSGEGVRSEELGVGITARITRQNCFQKNERFARPPRFSAAPLNNDHGLRINKKEYSYNLFIGHCSLVPDLPVPPASGFRHPCLNIERSADGIAFQNSSNSQLTSNSSSSLIAPWLNLGSGGAGNSVDSSPTSLTNTGNAFGGQGPITAPTSVGASSGFGGSGSYSSGSNSIAFNLGNGPSNQGLSSLAPSVYDSMGGGGGVSFASNIPSAASSAAYMQNLSASYPSVINNAVNQDMGGIIQATQEWNPLSSAMGSLGGALSSWGQAQASAGNAGWGATGMFLGGVANTAAGLGNPVSSLLSLGQASYNVAYRDGTAAGIGYGVGSLIGATQLNQAIMGENFATGQSLVGLNRWGMAFQGVSAASGAAALGAGATQINGAWVAAAGRADVISAAGENGVAPFTEYENQQVAQLQQQFGAENVAKQIYVRAFTQDPSTIPAGEDPSSYMTSNTVRLDAGVLGGDGSITPHEAKFASGPDPSYTANQRELFPLLEQYGGMVDRLPSRTPRGFSVDMQVRAGPVQLMRPTYYPSPLPCSWYLLPTAGASTALQAASNQQ